MSKPSVDDQLQAALDASVAAGAALPRSTEVADMSLVVPRSALEQVALTMDEVTALRKRAYQVFGTESLMVATLLYLSCGPGYDKLVIAVRANSCVGVALMPCKSGIRWCRETQAAARVHIQNGMRMRYIDAKEQSLV